MRRMEARRTGPDRGRVPANHRDPEEPIHVRASQSFASRHRAPAHRARRADSAAGAACRPRDPRGARPRSHLERRDPAERAAGRLVLARDETGEAQEEKVEGVVAERNIESHEEAAQRFLVVAIGAGLVSAAGLLAGRRGAIGRTATLAASAAVLAAGIAVGHSGGQLVYRDGAASAYTNQVASAASNGAEHPARKDDDD